jgi:kumamolisin
MIANTCISNFGVTTNFSNIVGISGNITTLQVATAYNFPASNGANVKVGVISLGGGFSQSDLNYSLANLGIVSLPTVTQVLVDGATGVFNGNIFSGNSMPVDSASFENTLDLYAVGSIVPSANIVLYISPGTTTTQWANVFQRAINEGCNIITHSWAIDEIAGYGPFLETVFANASAKGITILSASGDYGSEGGNNLGLYGPNSTAYPATSPNVVAVGGTLLTLNSGNVRVTETASTGSGGGVSTLFSVPTWQNGRTYQKFNANTSTYGPNVTLTTGTLGNISGNLIGRAVPDISAPMFSYALWFGGNIQAGWGGTSISTPILAGMFARFMSLNGGKQPPVGTITNSINPILYSNASGFYDITSGNNDAYNATGYAATSGWDAVTGLGAPWGNVLYPMVTSGGTKIKSTDSNWHYVANVKVKTATNTWSNVKAIWTKTINGWQQTF